MTSELISSRSEETRLEISRQDIQEFENVLLQELARVDLPTDSVFVNISERHRMLSNVGETIMRLSLEQRQESRYISKMIAAVHAGLFDAALNYLWDETIGELRRRAVGFDLSYFFDIAVENPDKRKHLKSEKHLLDIDDATLLRASHDIGLLTDIGYARLDHIRYMRNHASAAHPNQNELTGLDLVQWLEVCVLQVMTIPADTVTANIKKLLTNLRKAELDESTVKGAASFFKDLPQERANTLANGLFGQYVDPEKTPVVADNVRKLWPELWIHVSEDHRYAYGVRYGRYRANADAEQAKAARQLIDLVDATSYLTEQDRAVEIDAALDELLAAHNGWDNFYNEAAPARRLVKLIGDQGTIPREVRSKYLVTLVKTYLGNGHGVATSAEPHYEKLLEALTPELASYALLAFSDPVISNVLSTKVAQAQWSKLLEVLEPKLVTESSRQLLSMVQEFSHTPDKLRLDPKIRRLSKRIR